MLGIVNIDYWGGGGGGGGGEIKTHIFKGSNCFEKGCSLFKQDTLLHVFDIVSPSLLHQQLLASISSVALFCLLDTEKPKPVIA